jgi:hypothetical protein
MMQRVIIMMKTGLRNYLRDSPDLFIVIDISSK